MNLLEVKDLSVTFYSWKTQVEAVKHISFSLAKGEVLALVGESGSGKSVTALSLLQLLSREQAFSPSGSIKYAGQELIGASENELQKLRGNRIGMVFQEPMTALNPLHTIGKQIGEALLLHKQLSKNAVLATVERLLEQVGLEHFKHRLGAYPHQLSGGERQRVMIAMAIANSPSILIADEPTTALDVTVQTQILRLLKRLQTEAGLAMLLISHDLTLVRKVADRVAIMKHGEIVETGPVETIFTAPQHPYTQHLLASEPKGSAIAVEKSAPLMTTEGLKVYFTQKKGWFSRQPEPVKAVDDISFSVEQGTTLGIVGESGSGKTTLGLALLRLTKSEGKIVYQGQSLENLDNAHLRPLRKEMQIVFQDPFSSLNPRMNIEESIAEGLKVHYPELSEETCRERVREVVSEVGLEESSMERYPHEFSGGQRQRIAIARALILKPKLIILDEPTSALDLSIQAQIIALLKSLQQKHGLTYIFISHDLRSIKAISHKLVVMRYGKIVEEGPTEEIFAHPQQGYTKALIAAAFATTL